LIAACAEAGQASGTPVGVCGEAAADPALAPVLAGLGVGSLSMAANAIPAVREALAAHTLADCRRLAEAALTADDPAAAREAAASPPAGGRVPRRE
jgi:phosphotransferase system enzyme I (PtsI)